MSESTLPRRRTGGERGESRSWWGTLQSIGAQLSARSNVSAWLTVIVILAAGLRFTGLDWDQGTHRHPDERHLTMVVERVGWPASFGEYLDEQVSPLNPRNQGFFWVYGDFAVTIVKRAALTWNSLTDPSIPWDRYDRVYLVGRVVSALFDLGTLLALFFLARRLYGDHRVALLAAFLYALAVLPIQHSHFWVVDNFAVFFVTVTLYWLVRIFQADGLGKPLLYVPAGLFFGVALAIKVSIFTLAVVFAAVGLRLLWRQWRERGQPPGLTLERLSLRMGLAVLAAVFAFRLLQPYAFTGPGLLDVGLSERWLADMQLVQGQVTGESDPPWGYQWANRTPILFPLKNMVVWGMGLPLGLAAWAGLGVAFWQMVARGRLVHLIPVTWSLVLFLHQGTQWVKSMRYFLPIYPTLILLAAWLLISLWDSARRATAAGGGLRGAAAGASLFVVTGGTFLYTLAFMSIYTHPHTHVQATRWVYENVPSGSVLATEHFDEAFPVSVPGINPNGVQIRGLSTGQLEWYNPDRPEKLEQALDWLDEADYIATVSNRLYGSTARLPERYPMTINYYNALFSGELGWERVADFTSGPRLFGIELDDQFAAEEAFSVYDHPRVQIFKKTPAYNREKARALLSEGVDWDNISRLTAKQWTEIGGWTATLKLD